VRPRRVLDGPPVRPARRPAECPRPPAGLADPV